VDVVGPAPGQRVLDVGCGPGALTEVLVGRLGVSAVSAVDPSEAFVAAARARLPARTTVSAVAGGAGARLRGPRRVRRAGAREGHLAGLARDAGLGRAQSSTLTVGVRFETFQDWWEPLTLGVGSGGAYVQGLEAAHREALRERLERALGPAPFTASASAWVVRAEVPGSD
jgi:hypothetical protein